VTAFGTASRVRIIAPFYFLQAVGWVLPPAPHRNLIHKSFMTKIQNITAQEILDSRGNPTVMATSRSTMESCLGCVPSGGVPGIPKPSN